MDVSSRGRIEQACRTAEEFSKLYYDTIDKKRHAIGRLFMDAGLLTWNGNGVIGAEAIQKFYIDLPSSDHTINSLDAQPVSEVAVGDQLTFLIQVSGTVRYQDKAPKTFQQSFIVTAQEAKWKIVTDCFRLQDSMQDSK